MFQQLEVAPPDSILGLAEAFAKDPNPRKINLSVGVFKDESGQTPILPSVKEAERRLVATQKTKNYLGIDGLPEFDAAVQTLAFGAAHSVVAAGRAVTAQTPGGTAALRVAAELVQAVRPGATVWMSEPTWPNHPAIFAAGGLKVANYPYYDAASRGLAIGPMLAALESAPAGDIVLLHGCCHNPSGVDPTVEQWSQIAQVVKRRGLLPLVDFAYQGFGEGLAEDAAGMLTIAGAVDELLVCSSFSKNFGLYNERVGALTVVAASAVDAERALGHVKLRIRANYSNPPAHGAAVVATILGDAALRTQWEQELTAMRERIHRMRHLFVERLAAAGVQRDFSCLTRQRGMFSFSGLTPEQVKTLKEKYAIYIVGSGRINVAGMTEGNMDTLCKAIAEVVG
jgi:aspartate/tyrosine/aromatic aminotransferase